LPKTIDSLGDRTISSQTSWAYTFNHLDVVTDLKSNAFSIITQSNHHYAIRGYDVKVTNLVPM